MTIIYAMLLAGVWFISLMIAYSQGKQAGWLEGHEDTKKATFEVLDRKK